MSELTNLTLELATLRKRELQTSTQLESVVASEKQLQHELTNLKAKMSGEFEAKYFDCLIAQMLLYLNESGVFGGCRE